MNFSKLARRSATMYLLLIILFIILTVTSCTGQTGNGLISSELAATMVPDVNLDVYLYVNQGSPTSIPKDIVQAPQDIQVDSLALWGVINNEIYAVGAALAFTNASDAVTVYSQLPQQNDVWTKLVDHTIYLVQGSGGPADSLKNAISNNKFKLYDNQQALSETSRMPSGESIRPVAVCIVKPSQAAVNLVKPHIDSNTASTLDTLLNWGKPQIMAVGFYSSQKLEISDIIPRINNQTIWDMNLGVMVLVDSSQPGFIFSPIAYRLLDNKGYTKIMAGNLTEYETSLVAPGGKSIPVLINVDGNRVFVTASAQMTFAQTLLTGIKQ